MTADLLTAADALERAYLDCHRLLVALRPAIVAAPRRQIAIRPAPVVGVGVRVS